jgi:hypothetical protein
MVRRLPPDRFLRDEDHVASAGVSRLLVLGFLIAVGLGLLVGLGWVLWNLIRP